MHLSPEEAHVAACALRIAAAHYREDAATMRAASQPQVAAQFERQTKQAEALLERIEEEG